ncbi:hypothetical protein E4T42_09702 [Aureobasidium subglaciale]|uniref:PAS domain-containing protein n=1 Tax=Aureobasidium subglaciale (strain EXF-2481) TaxID=1043005 RepID=A0A074ZNW8_AURSE|nr:uncharacterized protein AUEXF2481DRAFT_25894 [Aureobasidium subglaciale EXF-2481]KAI5211374.1 hypothetical protein E4T38_01309 [Aureobasidium subglaciale]KAI5229613.1 hypothetical protein E4T40_01310 [Aureobasidium subglaciale]KAI5233429.1 hypothetical protein E4T41_01308 [Aureobasidium subglaciale]KAI5235474.1 hypothetical protein E4T42_09702 [Aureobasidium subglaciale]KAI5266554.1 hypothetical protein E4T46_01309 [Aureobasidium subglaciale]
MQQYKSTQQESGWSPTNDMVPTTYGRATDYRSSSGLSDTNNREDAKREEQSSTNTVAPSWFYDGLYSPSGFNIIDILIRVQRRQNPQIELGVLDANVALLLCDTSLPDLPIVYCSDGFEDLTGYMRTEIIGRNCRFLQTPPQASSHNHYRTSSGQLAQPPVRRPQDQQNLAHFKQIIMDRKEVQMVVTNYTKYGMVFPNMITVIPIDLGEGASPAELPRYLVGFQVNARSLVQYHHS